MIYNKVSTSTRNLTAGDSHDQSTQFFLPNFFDGITKPKPTQVPKFPVSGILRSSF